MERDDDISAALPGAPLPAPLRREAAIDAALARFDGAEAAPAAQRQRVRTHGWWTKLQQPRIGALVAVVLVVGISVPVALRMANVPIDIASEQAAPAVPNAAPPTAIVVAGAASAARAAAAPRATGSGEAAVHPPIGADENVAADKAVGGVSPLLPPPPPPSAPPPRMIAEADARASGAMAARRGDAPGNEIIVSAQRRSAPQSDTPVAVTAAPATGRLQANDNGEVIVTGAKMAAPKRAQRGDWNACTVDDPSQSLSRCGRLATQGNRKTREKVESYLADGLQNAWAGDTDGAVAAFDKAIAAAPQLSIAYLNRGLAYDRKGDTDRAIADLDRAVRHAPGSARAYYARSRILRKLGDEDRAMADAQRAVELDRRYRAVVE